MALYATRQRDDACDIVQDAMLRLADRYAGRPPDEWPALFFRILQRRIIDWHRRERLRRVLFLRPGTTQDAATDTTADIADPRGVSAERGATDIEIRARLEAAIAGLPRRQQQVYLLRELQGFDVRQTAKIMQCSTGSVKTHYARARAGLRAALEDYVA